MLRGVVGSTMAARVDALLRARTANKLIDHAACPADRPAWPRARFAASIIGEIQNVVDG